MTCKDCIHYDICIFHLKGDENKECCHFKNKADFVEVVRCKDCRFAYIDGDRAYCRNIETPWYNDYFEVFTKTSDFCSYGEMQLRRKE